MYFEAKLHRGFFPWCLSLGEGWLEDTIFIERFWILKSVEIVPLYAPGQNSRNEKYIQTSTVNGNLLFLKKFINQQFQKGSVRRI
jgi:hypothetical protein